MNIFVKDGDLEDFCEEYSAKIRSYTPHPKHNWYVFNTERRELIPWGIGETSRRVDMRGREVYNPVNRRILERVKNNRS